MSSDHDLLTQHLIHQSQYDSSNHFWHRLRWRWIMKKLSHRLSTPKVLDLGAGAGVAGVFMKRQAHFQYFFAEPIQTLREKLISDFGADRDLTDAKQYPGISSVLMLDVLEHIEDDQKFLQDLNQKMDPGAHLFILVPARQELWSSWDQKLGHYRRYTTQMLTKLGNESGFQVHDSRYLFPEFFVLGLIRKKFFAAKEGGAELPQLPNFLNECVFHVGRLLSTIFSRPPVGSSAFLHLSKKTDEVLF